MISLTFRLAGHVDSLNALSRRLRRLSDVAQSNGIQAALYDRLVEATGDHSRLRRALSQGIDAIKRHRELEDRTVAAVDIDVLEKGVRDLDNLVDKLDHVCEAAQSAYSLFSEGEGPLWESADLQTMSPSCGTPMSYGMASDKQSARE